MTTEGKSNPLALVGLLTLTLIWSYSWIAMKQVTLYIGAFDFTALRCISGALLLFIVLLLRGRGMRPTPFGYTLAIALLQTCGMIGLAQWALMSGGAGKVAILTYTMPFWVVIMAALFLGERMRGLQYAAIGVAAVGLCLVMQPWQLDLSSLKSALLAILSGISWGASAIVAKRMYRRHPGLDLLALTSWQMLYAAAIMRAVALVVPQQPVEWHPAVFGALAYSAILATALDEAATHHACGIQALMIENMHDIPYVKNPGPEITAAMTVAAREIKRAHPTLPLGIQILAGANQQALAAALAAGADFIRDSWPSLCCAITGMTPSP